MTDPEHRLYLAVLVQAICDYHGLTGATKVEIRDARDWVESNVDRLGSFMNVCALLDLEPQAVRKRVRHMTPERFTARINRSFGLTEPQLSMSR